MAQETKLAELARQLLVEPDKAGLSPKNQDTFAQKVITMGPKVDEIDVSAKAMARKPFTVDYILKKWALARASIDEAIDRGDDITSLVEEDVICTRAYVIRR
jgi:hypothetical protein